ncbi:MAG: signal peptidase I [Kibdelosporangium sp.]
MKWLLGKWAVMVVEGPSMRPTFVEGDRLLVRRRTEVRPGDVVVVPHPVIPGERMIKRVTAVPGDKDPTGSGRLVPDGKLVLQADDTGDSRKAGLLDASQVLGVVIRKVS